MPFRFGVASVVSRAARLRPSFRRSSAADQSGSVDQFDSHFFTPNETLPLFLPLSSSLYNAQIGHRAPKALRPRVPAAAGGPSKRPSRPRLRASTRHLGAVQGTGKAKVSSPKNTTEPSPAMDSSAPPPQDDSTTNALGPSDGSYGGSRFADRNHVRSPRRSDRPYQRYGSGGPSPSSPSSSFRSSDSVTSAGSDKSYSPPSRLRPLPPADLESSRAVAIRSRPRDRYLALAERPPRTFNSEPPAPLPLLVLDLNGTLVFRSGGRRDSSTVIRRPYLSSFLAYCLGVEDISYEERHDLDESAHNKRRAWWNLARLNESNALASLSLMQRPHGSHLWHIAGDLTDHTTQEVPAHPNAACRLLVWSSAQPHNVDAMVQSILHPRQASQLLRCWGRDTLVPQRFFQHKSPSIKDLEIVWNAVNQSLHENPSEQVAEGERRVRADYRDYQDYQEPDEGCIGAEDWHREGGSGAPSASERTFKAVRRAVTRPQRRRDRSWTPGAGYAAHNTLLLDDSPSKAALQPFNHLLIPEFEREAAYVTKRERAAARAAAKGGTQHIVSEDIDTVLLQTVGVIEHARYQRNVAAWIHSHGLGGFAGMQQAMGSAAGSAELIQREDVKEVGSGHEVINAEFEGHVADANTEALKPRLEMPSDQRTQAFWVREGINALRRRSMPLIL